MTKATLYIGLMSGTSADGIDLALVDFSKKNPQLIASYYQAYPPVLQNKITNLYQVGDNEIDRAGQLDIELAEHFAQAITQFLQQQQLLASDISAIGNHGQTIRHRPQLAQSFTLQIGCSQTLACLTGIRVIGQFRRKDMALGGQGAPLVPAFHQQLFGEPEHDVFVINIGGIANISYLPSEQVASEFQQAIIGFDTGPGNALLDAWFQVHNPTSQTNYDHAGQWSAKGKILPDLLSQLLADRYFQLAPPKSTGREYFHLAWLKPFIKSAYLAEDIQATLSALTAQSIANAIVSLSAHAKVYLFGGGVHNFHLKNQLIQLLNNYEIFHNYQQDINADNLEAMAFAWFAFAYDKKIYGNIPTVTGAYKQTVLGCAFYP